MPLNYRPLHSSSPPVLCPLHDSSSIPPLSLFSILYMIQGLLGNDDWMAWLPGGARGQQGNGRAEWHWCRQGR